MISSVNCHNDTQHKMISAYVSKWFKRVEKYLQNAGKSPLNSLRQTVHAASRIFFDLKKYTLFKNLPPKRFTSVRTMSFWLLKSCVFISRWQYVSKCTVVFYFSSLLHPGLVQFLNQKLFTAAYIIILTQYFFNSPLFQLTGKRRIRTKHNKS